jgi:hypothetical protein
MLKTKKTGVSASLALVYLLNLAGCGQSGPLYLPPKVALAVPAPLAVPSMPIIAHVGVS